MRRYRPVLLAILIAVSAFAPVAAGQSNGGAESTVDCEFPLEVTDATGETITLEEAPDSVVALQPSDAQTVFEIGAEDRLVGMPDNPATSDLPLGDRTPVTDTYQLVPERVIDLDPDLVLAANATDGQNVEQLRNAGLTVYHLDDAGSIDDVRDNVRTVGQLTGECDGAEETVDWMDEQLEIVDRTLEDEERPLAYYAMGDGYTAGAETFIHEVLTTGGVENVAEREGIASYGQINPETVVAENPEWIIYPDDRDEPPIHETIEATTASQEGNVHAVNANHISQPAPQVVYAIVDIVETVHPEAYEQASAELEAADEGGTESADEGDTGTDGSGDGASGESMPGFGVAAAVVALVAATGFVARRR
ncbi:PGF-CTERM-anchored ABC transporter substrate-binding protein [Natrinema longum]|uniref:ABC transporter substrate-binding protein n=1 Tax=Natrinema longum TaxID=370324 RepID=A0A8A2U9P8_9EURY|nr:PGF-CTERM-anchored ABC transporter substrate-binding protein [Natrinema longum]MBZ6496696.1 helical backbone metal receptor [Natrinema longum]QSW85410.1 ABC transporter substrate-binding protein [Natrinema longum]